MPDQAHGLRNLMFRMTDKLQPPRERPSQLIVTVGAKRGVGTSTVTANLAATLAHQGQRVVLLDGHLENNDVATPAGLLRLQDQLRSLQEQTEIVLLDAGAGVNLASRHFAPIANQLLVVTTCDAIAVMDTYATIKLLCSDKHPNQLSLVTNQAPDRERATDVHDRVAQSCRRFLALPLNHAGSVPSCDSVTANPRRPVVLEAPSSPASRGLQELALELIPTHKFIPTHKVPLSHAA